MVKMNTDIATTSCGLALFLSLIRGMFHPDKLFLPEKVWQCEVEQEHIAKPSISDYPHLIRKLKIFSIVRNSSVLCKTSKCLKPGFEMHKVKQRSQCPCSASVFKCRAIARLRCVMESGGLSSRWRRSVKGKKTKTKPR